MDIVPIATRNKSEDSKLTYALVSEVDLLVLRVGEAVSVLYSRRACGGAA